MVLEDLLTRDDLPEDVREAVKRLSSIYDAVGSVIFQLGVEPADNFRFLFANKAFLAVTGLTEGQVVGRRFQEVIPESSHALVLGKYKEAIRERRTVRWEEVSPYPTGVKTGEVTITPVLDQKGFCAHLVGSIHDITEPKRAEEALHLSEGRYRTLVERLPDGVYRSTPEGRFLEVNPALVRILGYDSRQEVLALDDIASRFFDGPEDRERVNTLQQRGDGRAEFRVRRMDGSMIWVEDRCHFVCDDAGNVVLHEGTCRDITQLKQTEEALRDSEKHYRLLADNATDVIWTRKLDLSRSYISPSVERQRGFSVEEAMTHSFEESMTPASATLAKDTLAKELAWTQTASAEQIASRSVFLELEMACKDGSTVPTEVTARFLCDAEGRPHEIMGITRDITERKRAEETLRESEERLNDIIETSPALIFRLDSEGHFTFLNSTWETVLGYRPDEMLGHLFVEFKAPERAKTDLETFKKILQGEETHGYETTYVSKSGELVRLLFNARLIRDTSGKVIGSQGNALDITAVRKAEEERKALEAQLQHAQKLESLGVLAGGVAHDFNNLLVGMLGHSDLALTKLPSENPARTHVEGVMQAAERAADLSRQMLAYSGHGHFIVKPTDLSALVRENVHLLKAGIPKGVQLRTDLCDTPALIEADVGQMQQVIMNLAINAAEAIGDRPGYVTISTGFETLAGEEARYSRFTATELNAGRYVFLEVRDDGPGMDEETLSKVFDPFFTTKFVGRGLGLSALLGIVRGHKGGIDVQSGPGKGTTFRLVFPVTEETPEDTKVVAAEGSLEGTILVIDDEEIVRTMTSEMLTPQGLKVLTAESGAAGVALYEERRADIGLVLLDYSMPEMGGEETFRELRKLRPDVPVLLSSGFGQEEATRRFKGQDLTGFIQKPYRLAALLEEVRRCLGRG